MIDDTAIAKKNHKIIELIDFLDKTEIFKKFSISKDSSRIVFNSIRSESIRTNNSHSTRAIHTIDLAGTNFKTIYKSVINWFDFSYPPVWSPDGKYIAFTDGKNSYDFSIKIKEVDSTSEAVELKDINGNPIKGHIFGWSADEE